MLRRLKAHIDRDNERWLGTLPTHERDQVLEAAKTWRGAVRHVWGMFRNRWL